MNNMSNQYTKGYSKNYVENYFKADLKSASKEVLQKHYEKRGYTKATVDKDGKTYTIKMPLYKHIQPKGERFYIECGQCGKRVTYLLYQFRIIEGRQALIYACRHCMDVNYISQQVTKNDIDYNTHVMQKIGRKLDPDFTFDDEVRFVLCPFKPKHMKQVAYDRYRKEFVKHRNEVHRKFSAMLGVPVDEEALEEMQL